MTGLHLPPNVMAFEQSWMMRVRTRLELHKLGPRTPVSAQDYLDYICDLRTFRTLAKSPDHSETTAAVSHDAVTAASTPNPAKLESKSASSHCQHHQCQSEPCSPIQATSNAVNAHDPCLHGANCRRACWQSSGLGGSLIDLAALKR